MQRPAPYDHQSVLAPGQALAPSLAVVDRGMAAARLAMRMSEADLADPETTLAALDEQLVVLKAQRESIELDTLKTSIAGLTRAVAEIAPGR